MSRRTAGALAAAAAYAPTVAAANWAITEWGVVRVGFGYSAPAAVYFVGLALVLRDLVQWVAGGGRPRTATGIAWSLAALAVGIGLSYWTAGAGVATASAAAFAVSESVDLLIFTVLAPGRRRTPQLTAAVVLAGAAAAVADTYVFLAVAPTLVPGVSNYTFVPGQLIGKSYGIVLAAVLIPVVRLVVGGSSPEPATA
jgi:hypothetical protein